MPFLPSQRDAFPVELLRDRTGRERLVVVEEMLRRCVAAGLL